MLGYFAKIPRKWTPWEGLLQSCQGRLFILPHTLLERWIWIYLGELQQMAFDKIKEYLLVASVLRAPRRKVPFKLYIASEEEVISTMLTQEDNSKEYIIAYIGQHLLDPKTMYANIEKLCLSYTMHVLGWDIICFLIHV